MCFFVVVVITAHRQQVLSIAQRTWAHMRQNTYYSISLKFLICRVMIFIKLVEQ